MRAMAQNKASEGSTKESTSSREAEAERIAELERRSGKNRKAALAKQLNPTPASSSSSGGGEGFAEWNEGELLPKGWENMNPIQKAGELWAGKRGALFWANKAAWASLFIVGGAWLLFRVVGPLTGLYTLKNDLLSPPNQ